MHACSYVFGGSGMESSICDRGGTSDNVMLGIQIIGNSLKQPVALFISKHLKVPTQRLQ